MKRWMLAPLWGSLAASAIAAVIDLVARAFGAAAWHLIAAAAAAWLIDLAPRLRALAEARVDLAVTSAATARVQQETAIAMRDQIASIASITPPPTPIPPWSRGFHS